MKNFIEWSEKIKNEIKLDKEKKIILLAGASSSGKSYTAQKLNEYLNNFAIKSFVFTADSYYKGISRIITQKVLLKEQFKKYANIENDITKAVRSVIEFVPFTDKFTDENFNKILSNLSKICPKDACQLCFAIKDEFDKINFDEPFAIDFVSLSKDINKILNNQDIVLPTYSFATGEPTLNKDNIISGNYDIYIIEGLYTLRDELLECIDKRKVIPCLVDCDIKTLLARRLNRDIKSGRTTFSPEQTIISTLTKTMPSYFENIHPFNKNSKHTLENSITTEEIDKKDNSTQLKFLINKSQYLYLKSLNLEKIYDKKEIDYYFEDNNFLQNFIVRIREIDGLANTLTFKMNKCSNIDLNRKIEEYDLKDFLVENRYISNILQSFLSSGFSLGEIITKNRQIYKYNNISFKLDKVDGLGAFIEFDTLNTDTQEIIDLLGLTKKCTTPYIDLIKYKHSKICTQENELDIQNEEKIS